MHSPRDKFKFTVYSCARRFTLIAVCPCIQTRVLNHSKKLFVSCRIYLGMGTGDERNKEATEFSKTVFDPGLKFFLRLSLFP